MPFNSVSKLPQKPKVILKFRMRAFKAYICTGKND